LAGFSRQGKTRDKRKARAEKGQSEKTVYLRDAEGKSSTRGRGWGGHKGGRDSGHRHEAHLKRKDIKGTLRNLPDKKVVHATGPDSKVVDFKKERSQKNRREGKTRIEKANNDVLGGGGGKDSEAKKKSYKGTPRPTANAGA